MENDLSNNEISNNTNNLSTTMETMDFFEQMLLESINRSVTIGMDAAADTAVDTNTNTNTTTFIPSSISRNRRSFQSPFRRPITNSRYNTAINNVNTVIDDINDMSNNLANIDTETYIRFFEDILQLPPLNSANPIRTLLETSLNDQSQYKQVLSTEGEATIKTVFYNPEIHNHTKCCPITQIDFNKDDELSQLPCGHLFNTSAILKWLKEEKAECPICRFKMKSHEKKIEFSIPTRPSPPPPPLSAQSPPPLSTSPSHVLPMDLSGNVNFMNNNNNNNNNNTNNNSHPFGPRRIRRRNYNFNNLMMLREEEEALQEALLASLEEEYMPKFRQQELQNSDSSDNDNDHDHQD